MTVDTDPVLAVAVRAARTAASIVVDAARDLKRLPSFSKAHGEIVSAADIEAEDAIIATLRAAFPEHAILGEESGHIEGARDSGGYKWLVDPHRRHRQLRPRLPVLRRVARRWSTAPT